MIWTVAALDTTCGNCRVSLAQGEPMALVRSTRRVRCLACAERAGFAVDWTAIDHERFRLEAETARETHTGAAASLPVQRTSHRRPVPLSEVAGSIFDPKAAAANDGRDDE